MKASLIFLLLSATATWSVAEPQSVGFQGYISRFWQAQDGLLNQTVQALAQTADGNLWIGTDRGLLRFNGAQFVAYRSDVAPVALERGVNCLLASRDGSLWIGTEGGGLVRYWERRFQAVPTVNGRADQFVRAIYKDSSGTIWVGADQGLFQVTGSSIERIDANGGIPAIFVRAITEDRQGHIWVGGTSLLELKGRSMIKEYSLPGGPDLNLVTSMEVAGDDKLWVGTLSGLHLLKSSGLMARLPGISSRVSVIRKTSDGALWVGTLGQGLFLYRGHHLIHVASLNLPSTTVETVLEDREEDVWLGTQAGLVRLCRTPVSIVSLPGGQDSEFESLYRGADGTIWVASSKQLFRIQNRVAQRYVFPGLSDLRVRTVVRDRVGRLWLGTNGSGLIELDGRRVRRFTVRNGLTNDFVRVIFQSRDGRVWVGTDGGLSYIGPEGVKNVEMSDGLAYFCITALFEDHGGDIWVGTFRGLSHIAGGRIVRDAVTQAMREEELWSICQDSSGELWFGTSSGLFGYKAGKLVHLTTADGLASNTVYQILDDSKGSIWLSGPSSVSRLSVGSLDEFASGAQHRVDLTLYLDSHDLESAALYSGFQPEGAVGPNGDLWYPSSKGAVHIDVHRIVSDTPFPVAIDRVIANGQSLPLSRNIVLRPDNGRLEISYSAIDLRSLDGLRYRYRMEGLEPWIDAFARTTAYYTHIPPGTYRFRVQAFNVGNPKAVSETSILVAQEPHIYATSWFFGCCVIALLGLVFLIYRFRLRGMRLRFQAVSTERERLAREMHDTVIQGCIGVSTLLEAALGVEAADEPLRQQLLSFATDQVRTTIETAREAVWALRDTSASSTNAGSLCESVARQFQSESGVPIKCRVEGIAFTLGESATRELMMTVREALTNAVLHGNPKSIDIDVCFTEHDLKIGVRDDGCGFDPHGTLSRDGHFGILGMQERVRLLGGDLKIESDLVQGTRVYISVPRRRRALEGKVVGDVRQSSHEV